jgi:methylmalonyl-CoA mutase cobalamin-binding subunit
MELGLGALGDIEAAELLHSPEQLVYLASVLQEHQEQHRGVVSLARGRGRRHVLGCVGPALQPLRTA